MSLLTFSKLILQVIALSLLYILGNEISHFLQIPIPGSIIGMALLYILLDGGYVKLSWFELGSNFLINNLLLFFIPSAIGIIDYTNLFSSIGLLLIAVVITSIIAVLASIIGSTLWASKLKRRGYRLW